MAINKGLSENLTIIFKTVTVLNSFSESMPIPVKEVLTTAGTIKKVFESNPNESISQAGLFYTRIQDMLDSIHGQQDVTTHSA